MKVLVFPRDPSPYQEQLYSPMRKRGTAVAYLDRPLPSHTLSLLLLPWVLVFRRLQGYRTFHLHWLFLFSLPWAGAFGRMIMQGYFMGFLRLAKLLGYKLVWTAHNALPHENLFYDDRAARAYLFRYADCIIVHTAAARAQLAELGAPVHNIHYISLGGYIGHYPDTTSKKSARQKLGLPQAGKVVLFFGQIRPYKGLEKLLSAYASLADNAKPQLVIAGQVKDKKLEEHLKEAAANDDNIHLSLGFVPDEDVQFYFRAADFTVLPYEKGTTSAVALLACSFACPVIVPDLTVFGELPVRARLVYKTGELARALTDAKKMRASAHSAMQSAALAYARRLSWPAIAAETEEVLACKR